MAVFIAFGCSTFDKQSRKIRSANNHFETNRILFLGCAYEMTKGTCVYLWTNHHFAIEFSNNKYSKQYYAGKYTIKADTVYFLFYKNIKPANITNYFLKEPDDQYILIFCPVDLRLN